MNNNNTDNFENNELESLENLYDSVTNIEINLAEDEIDALYIQSKRFLEKEDTLS